MSDALNLTRVFVVGGSSGIGLATFGLRLPARP